MAVAFVYVCREVFANVALLAGLHKLVFVVHIIEIHSRVPVSAVVVVAQLIVGHVFRLGRGIAAVVGEVVALRLAACVSHGEVCVVSALVEADSRLGIPKIIFFVNVEELLAVVALVESVVQAACLVEHVAVLQVAEHVEEAGHVVCSLCECGVVVLACVGVVILVACEVLNLPHV